MNTNIANKEDRFSEGIMLLFISAGTYLFAFFYEQGFVSYFNIPSAFVRISIDSVLIFGGVILGVSVLLIPIINGVVFFLPKNIHVEIKRFLVLLVGFVILVLFLAIIYGFSNWPYWRSTAYLVLVYISIQGFFTFIFPLITQRNIKGYKAKLDAQQKFDQEFHRENSGGLYDFIANRFGIKVLILVLVLLLGVLVSRSIGFAEAVKQKEFLVTNTSPELVVIRVYGDNMICAQFDQVTREVESNFVILKLADDPNLVLRIEEIGPLFTSITLNDLKSLPTSTPTVKPVPTTITTNTP